MLLFDRPALVIAGDSLAKTATVIAPPKLDSNEIFRVESGHDLENKNGQMKVFKMILSTLLYNWLAINPVQIIYFNLFIALRTQINLPMRKKSSCTDLDSCTKRA